ncbi:MAG TPA: hypothetical protein VGN59_18120 [Acidimicrobiia bacterium]
MRAFGLGLVVVALALVGIRAAAAAAPADRARASQSRPVVDARPPTRVSLFGDSLAYQAQATFSAALAESGPVDLHAVTYPTTALCDFRSDIATDLVTRRPQVLVLEFSGNSFTPCMRDAAGRLLDIGSGAWRDRYVEDLRAVLRLARVMDTTVVWATAPPVDHPTAPLDYPRRLAAAVADLAATDGRLRVVDTGASVAAPGRRYARTLPCRADEPFCRDGRVVVRATDGLHFDCHGTPDATMGCSGYSAGARRFGDALARAARER